MKEAQTHQDNQLTWESFRDIWQLAVSDRKRLSLQFDFLDKSGLMDDAVFYASVLERMRADPSWRKSLSRAFQSLPRERDQQRSFEYRSKRWLKGQIQEIVWSDDADAIHPPLATWPALEREVYALWFEQVGTTDQENDLRKSNFTSQPMWQILVAQMGAAVASFTSPNVDNAKALVATAEELMLACQRHIADEERLASLHQQRADLVETLSSMDVTPEALSTLEMLQTPEALAQAETWVAEILPLQVAAFSAKAALHEAEAADDLARNDPSSSKAVRAAALNASLIAEGAATVANEAFGHGLETLLIQLRRIAGEVPILSSKSSDKKSSSGSSSNASLSNIVTISAQPDDVKQSVAAETPPIDAPKEPEPKPNESPAPHIFDEANAPPSDLPPPTVIMMPPAPEVEPVAIWTGRQPIDEVFAQFLDRGDIALAWHLAYLAEENGITPPVPSILLKSLVASEALTGPYDAAAQLLGEWLAAAIAEVELAEARGPAAGLRARSVALAALLQPALMARDTNARDHLRNLSLADGLQTFAPVVALLRDLRRDLQPSIADLHELAGGEKQRRLPAAFGAIQEWLPGALNAKTSHAPSVEILHKFLEPQGALGQLFEAVVAGDINQLEIQVGKLIALSSDKREAATMVAMAEKEMGRPKRDAIRGTALDWILRNLREGAELLLDWRSAYWEDEVDDTKRKATLGPLINELRKEMAHCQRRELADSGVDAAVQRLLDRALAQTLAIVEGRATQSSVRPAEALGSALLRLPGLCQPYAPDDPAFAQERREQRHALFLALQQPETLALSETSALVIHLEKHALLPAQALISRLERQQQLSIPEVQARHYDIENVRHIARENARREITGLRHDLEPLQSIDLASSPEIQVWLDRFALIDRALIEDGDYALPFKDGQRSPAIPPDFPHLAQVIAEVSDLRDRVREGIRYDQFKRLEDLSGKLRARGEAVLADEALLVAGTLNARDPITVEDILIRLQNGQSFTLANEVKVDHFGVFFPGFVSSLMPETDTSKIQEAIQKCGSAGPMDYTDLQEDEVKRALELHEKWRAVVNAFNKPNVGSTLSTFMERLGFTSVLIERETSLSAQLRWMWMRTNPLSSQDWFLPPMFGSEARGSYPVFLAHRNVDDAQLVAEMAKVGRDAPCILLVLGRLSKVRRENFGLAMRKAKQTVLLIDEAQVLYLTTGGNWMERLFACAAPFGYLQPYTTSPGNIPVEMFFGRETEIGKIESATADGCLVYGGRQLGKSALLHHVRKRFHQPATGRHAYYIKIDEFGGQVQPAAQIWSEIRRVLLVDQLISKISEKPAEIRSSVLDWLSKGGERRILLLVDEADLFLASEARSGFANLNPLKDLMEETSRRFKVVFAGLHNVRRMAKAPNSPLVHLSEPICIGPLNTSAESSQQARRLVVEPMKAAGFDYEKPELVHSLLTRVNFYPSLMQVFLKALLEGLSNQVRPQGAGPRWLLKEEQLFRGPSSEGINIQIRERFQWTLNLDPRYELIAKVLARHRILSADAEGGAMAADDLRLEAETFWPKGQDKLGRVDFPAFLDEMVDLGVLIRMPGPVGVYGLRGAQVAQMLGQLEQLEDEILKIAEKEARVDYDPNHYYRRAGPDYHIDRRAPLPDLEMAALFNTAAPGVRVVIAAPAVLGVDQIRTIADLAEGWNDGIGLLSSEVFRGQEQDLRRLVDRFTGRKVLVLQAQGSKPEWLNWLAENKAVQEGRLLPIFVGSPEVVARLWARDQAPNFLVFRSKPWERTMMRAWLWDSGLTLLDEPDTREALLAVTGGSPAALTQLRAGLEALVAGGRRDDSAARVRDLGREIKFSAGQVGLPDRLVPLFCTIAELVEGGGEAEGALIELLASENPNVATEISQMTELGLFSRPEPNFVALSPLGAVLYRDCNVPRKQG